LNEAPTEISTHGGLEVQTLEELMDAITSIVTIGIPEDPRAATRHLSFMRFWADRLAAIVDRQPSQISLAILLRIDARHVARDLAPTWNLSAEDDCTRAVELLQQHARAFAREDPLLS
jgi:hypothetical protein